MASLSICGVPWGSASFRLVVQAVVSRIPLIHLQASKEEDLEKRKAGNFKNDTGNGRYLCGLGGNFDSVSFRGFRLLSPGRLGGGFVYPVNLSPGVRGGFGETERWKLKKRNQK